MSAPLPPPVHFYVPDGMTFADRILCRTPDKGLNTHVAELAPQVTCAACRAILHAREQQVDDEQRSDWPDDWRDDE